MLIEIGEFKIRLDNHAEDFWDTLRNIFFKPIDVKIFRICFQAYSKPATYLK